MPTNGLLRLLRYLHAIFYKTFLLLLVVVALSTYFITWYRVDGRSMEPTIHHGQWLMVNLIQPKLHAPQVGDIVIVRYSGDHTVNFVKRITGVAGDKVQFKGRDIYLASGEFFVVGDNLQHSTDSRTFGPIKSDQIVGIVLFIPLK